MNSQTQVNVSKWVICFGLAVFFGLEASPALGQSRELMKRSSIVFVGTVTKMAAVAFPDVQASKKTVVVKVDQLLEKPAAVFLSAGQQITVELKDPSVFHEGLQATFYTEGWIFGKGIAVREVGHELTKETLSASAMEKLQQQHSKTRQELKETELRARIESSDLVLVGRVTRVRPSTVTAPGPKFISEHDPNWQEAVIQVISGIKGIPDGGQVVVRFPGSDDVVYYETPKFKEKQEGVFLLQKDTFSGLANAILAGTEVEAYTAQRSLDVLSKEEADKVRAIIGK